MANNPFSYSDPLGDEPITLGAILIAGLISAGTYTASHFITNGFTFNNWSWANFAGAFVAGGISGGLLTPALTNAGIGGFAGGFVSNAGGSFAGSLTSQLLQGSVSGKQLFRETGVAGLLGGLTEGLRAGLDGRRFWDGARVEYQLIVEDAGLKHILQAGDNNCTCATGEMALRSQGYDVSQQQIRGWMGGDPYIDPLDDVAVISRLSRETGVRTHGIQRGSMSGYINKNDYIIDALREGNSVIMTIPGNPAAHTVSVKGSYFKIVTRVNGFRTTTFAHRIFDPAVSKPYIISGNNVNNNNNITIFSLWRQ